MMEGTIAWMDKLRDKHKKELENNKKEGELFNGRDGVQRDKHKEGPREQR